MEIIDDESALQFYLLGYSGENFSGVQYLPELIDYLRQKHYDPRVLQDLHDKRTLTPADRVGQINIRGVLMYDENHQRDKLEDMFDTPVIFASPRDEHIILEIPKLEAEGDDGQMYIPKGKQYWQSLANNLSLILSTGRYVS